MPELYIILILMIIGAGIAVTVRDLLSSIVAVGAVGLGLSIVFLILKAPDLAIVQLAVEILCVVLLMRAVIKRDTFSSRSGLGFISVVIFLVFTGVFLTCIYGVIRELPEFGYPAMKVASYYIQNGLVETGAANLVSAIILNYRAYDTLGEATVLITAVIGALAVLRRIGRKKPEEIEKEEDD